VARLVDQRRDVLERVEVRDLNEQAVVKLARCGLPSQFLDTVERRHDIAEALRLTALGWSAC
jgi:hypothetical protein